MRPITNGDDRDTKAIGADIDKSLAPFHAIIEEIQISSEAGMFASMLVRMGLEQNIAVFDLLRIAFSHGVMVGIEMEKAPLLVGRSALTAGRLDVPGEATRPTEAKPE